MTKKERIEELERRVQELETRPIQERIIVVEPVRYISPWRPRPNYVPSWWEPYETGTAPRYTYTTSGNTPASITEGTS